MGNLLRGKGEPIESFPDLYQAILDNNSSYDGTFWYANRKRRSFCRPSCKSKTNYPREYLTVFFSANEAMQKGYTACKRCHANDLNHQSPCVWLDKAKAVAEEYIETYRKVPKLQHVAISVRISQYHLHRKFKFKGRPFRKYCKWYLDKISKRVYFIALL